MYTEELVPLLYRYTYTYIYILPGFILIRVLSKLILKALSPPPVLSPIVAILGSLVVEIILSAPTEPNNTPLILSESSDLLTMHVRSLTMFILTLERILYISKCLTNCSPEEEEVSTITLEGKLPESDV